MTAPALRFQNGEKSPGLILAGIQSSGGKTAVTCLLLAALRQRGVPFQGFKIGPDFIDVSYHSRFAGAPSRNLDTWLLGNEGAKAEAEQYGAGKISIAEGVMGLFDGAFSTSEIGSTMEMARLLDWPIILVLPCATAGRSIIATVRGFIAEAGPGQIAGVILNQVGGSSHSTYLREALGPLNIPVLGAISRNALLEWPERHLGLQAAQERVLPSWEELAKLAEQQLDLDGILDLVQPAAPRASVVARPTKQKRIALARDEAFHLYYASNLDYLRERGIECVEFSPLRDKALPGGIDGVVFGGGFPEVYAEPLAANESLRRELKSALQSGLPCYAECGGLMYLTEKLRDLSGRDHPMLGILPGTAVMTNTLQHFGYCEARFAGKDERYRGHEFHHSRWDAEENTANLWQVARRANQSSRTEGFKSAHLHASYVHLLWSQSHKLVEKILGV
jgi:cobyrinic acid a,c-diamide synthase